MSRNRPTLWLPILLGALAIIFTIAVLVAWNVIFTQYYILATNPDAAPELGIGHWLTLGIGCLFLVGVITVLVMGLVSNIRQALYVRLQKTFIDSVTHELKSPLASIRLGLDTLEMREMTPEMQARFLQMMRKDVDRLQAFIEHILEAGRLEQSTRHMEFHATPLHPLLERCLEPIYKRHAIAQDAVTLRFDLPDDSGAPFHVITDPMALEIILTNLIDNAVKYSPIDRVHIEVRVWSRGPTWGVEVRDQGLGIPPKLLKKKIFERFYRVERSDTPDITNIQGTGLGLYVVRSLVKRLGGRIRAESPGPDQGSTFSVTFPHRAVANASPASTASSPPSSALNPLAADAPHPTP